MANKKNRKKEWFIDLPWGKLALISWGKSSQPPVLLLHGYMDNAGTFVSLVEQLPDTYYYLSFDMPGHGKSDPFPLGPLPNQGHIVEVMNMVIEQLKWRTFVFIGHSMGYTVGALYNRVYPRQISRLVALDPEPPIANFYYSDHLQLWYINRFPVYYEELDNSGSSIKKYYTKDQTLSFMMERRGLTAAQAQPIAERSLVPVGNGVYKLSFEINAKLFTNIPLSYASLLSVVTMHPIPMLVLHASESITRPLAKKSTKLFMDQIRNSLPHFEEKTINCGHDLHLTNAEDCARFIGEFLGKDFRNKRCKL